MNPYDKAHELARTLKASAEYRTFLAAKEALAVDPEAKKMVQDFLRRKMEQEYEALAGKEDPAKAEALNRMYELLAANGKAREFLEAYLRFQRIMADISKIIGDSVAEGLDLFAKD
ncbi:YlbF family regulator [Anaeroselena agilis]|uniref:YlbF family regulator n=1 Tax=Anaeroselena agilis TaxID=3063788 RepID=A0ABU3NUR7_9FIRM|nr:YlbF family regulator [Selenomonadales bacterium 4137-cl]